jgi:protein-tyrosine kinase
MSGDAIAIQDESPASVWQFNTDDLAEPQTNAAAAKPAVAAPPDDDALKADAAAAALRTGRRKKAAGRVRALALKVAVDERNKLVIAEHVESGVMEQFRHLAAVLHHAQAQRGTRSLMVTSALPSEGKTLMSTNLALTMSESYQRRVLLIDADLRRPRMHEMFGLSDGPGLTDSLVDPLGGKLPVHQVTDNLWVLAAGSATPDPMSTLVSGAMKDLIADAQQAFDWVIVDTPPIAILPDANLLAGMIDSAVLVVNAGSTPYPMVQRAADAIGRSRILGVVLNRAEEHSATTTHGYYNYGSSQRSSSLPQSRWSWLGSQKSRPQMSHAAPATMPRDL